ncbi:MAG TPA: DUF1353 domain-containing protein [Candidatus Didemnitutus sp.]|nr:DUF1353 domain-containing protein [Candidatus Didemnitutus sp.]
MNRFFDTKGDVSVQLSPEELQRRRLPVNVAQFELREELRFRSDIAGGVIRVPVGYLSDLASIPQFAWSIFMVCDDPRIELGGWVHDVIYGSHGRLVLEDGRAVALSRQQADAILAHEAMTDLCATSFQRWAVYRALRWFGHGWPGDSFAERFA